MKKYNQYLVTMLMAGVSFFSHGQIRIKADTIGVDCLEVYRTKKEIFIIKSQDDYDRLGFFEDACTPFNNIDFDANILVGYKFYGSNCDKGIQWSRIVTNRDGYLIQFAIHQNHACRDLQTRLAWFIIDRPLEEINISFEKKSGRQE